MSILYQDILIVTMKHWIATPLGIPAQTSNELFGNLYKQNCICVRSWVQIQKNKISPESAQNLHTGAFAIPDFINNVIFSKRVETLRKIIKNKLNVLKLCVSLLSITRISIGLNNGDHQVEKSCRYFENFKNYLR